MTFTRRYITWLLAPPAVFTLPLAFGFVSQVVQLNVQTGATLIGLLLLLYAGVGFAFAVQMRESCDAVEAAVAARGDVSPSMSECLDRTKSVAVMLWSVGGLLFAALATVLVMRTGLGFAYFFVAALIAGGIAAAVVVCVSAAWKARMYSGHPPV